MDALVPDEKKEIRIEFSLLKYLTPIENLVKYLNFETCGKVYLIKQDKEKKKFVSKVNDEKQK